MPETQGSGSIPGILAEIVHSKEAEVAALLRRSSDLHRALAEAPAPRGFAAALRADDRVALIAEVKRRSPGAGAIRPDLDPALLAAKYRRGGASALSVLTDGPFFGGGLGDLEAVRRSVDLPVLRKDFTVHEIQIVEARGHGADAVLLIVRILDQAALVHLLATAHDLGMTALVEVHDGMELQRALSAGATVVGINNRDLATFTTDPGVTLGLLHELPSHATVVSESGIHTRADVERLGGAGVDAVLVGESLLRQRDAGEAARALVGVARGPR